MTIGCCGRLLVVPLSRLRRQSSKKDFCNNGYVQSQKKRKYQDVSFIRIIQQTQIGYILVSETRICSSSMHLYFGHYGLDE